MKQFKSNIADIGPVREGNFSRELVFEREPGSSLIIDKIVSSCGCSIASWSRDSTSPVKISVNASISMDSQWNRHVTVYFVGGANEYLQLTASCAAQGQAEQAGVLYRSRVD